jgi:hypothetical protein
MLVFLDYFFVLLHGSLVCFNLTGWIWRKTRRLHLVLMSLVLLSWFGLGLVYGWGYCPCTDWHWQVKRELGERGLPASYIKYYADNLTGLAWDAQLVNLLTLVITLVLFALSVWLNWRMRGTSH